MFLENEREGGGVVRVRPAQTSTFASRSRGHNYGTVWCSGAGPDEAQHESRTTGRAPDIAGHLVPAKGPPSATVIFAYACFSFDIWEIQHLKLTYRGMEAISQQILV